MSKVILVHQKDIQMQGGICAKYPVSCLIRDLLNEAGLLRPFKPLRVLDLTYGEGRFWPAVPLAYIVAFDKAKLNWHRRPAEFYKMSCVNWKKKVGNYEFDLIVADPPFMAYRRGQEKRRHYEDNGDLPLILNEARKAAEHFRCPLLIHFMWKAVPYGFTVIAERWFKGWVRVLAEPRPTWFGILEGAQYADG